ncbi:MAG TPA: helix-turn-helix domain-containing protein [Oculatellaceae cyanobacterium]
MEQTELFKAQTSWFHVFKSMVDSGDVAKMGPGPTTVYLVLKAYTNFQDGRSFPSLTLIGEKTGFGIRQVQRHLKVLEEYGYVKTESGRAAGKSNRYTLREKVVIRNNDDEAAAIATWDYLPSTVKAAVAELRNVVIKGDFDGVQLINIQRLDINIGNIGFAETMFQINADLQKLDPETRQSLESAIKRSFTTQTVTAA